VAFASLGSRTEAPPPTSLVLDARFQVQFFPEPLPVETAQIVVQEYEAWLVGSALKELDQHFAAFLDEVWHVLRLTEHHGRELPTDYGPDKPFLGDTNAARKLSLVATALQLEVSQASAIEGLSFARNALSHNRGVVRERDTNEPGLLRLTWQTPLVVIKNSATGTEVDSESPGFHSRVFGADDQPYFRMAAREKAFAVGDRIMLSAYELSGIIWSYQNASNTIIQGLHAHCVAKGIEENSKMSDAP
jgi:hypothetical protein